MKARLRRNGERHLPLAHQGQENHEGRDAAQKQDLTDRVGGDEPLPHDVVHGEHEHAEQHQADADQRA